jgi:inosine-uridine nucleoside N-ribohydrolase
VLNMPERIPILLDTDIGSDIDDAVALAYLLRQPHAEIVGITTVTGEPRRRAALADYICRAAGREDVPIHSGAAAPLLVPQIQPAVPQAAILGSEPYPREFAPNSAVEFMQSAIRRRPGEITLLAIGPLTNIALLFSLYPDIPAMLKQVVLMCGAFNADLPEPYNERAEWNASGDPHSTAIVYRAPVHPHTSIGLDVTLKCRMAARECRRRFIGEPLETVAGMAEVWFKHQDYIIFHDPLAAAIIFEPGLCSYSDGLVNIDLASPKMQGMTIWTPDKGNNPHRIAVDVNVDAFFEHYFSVASG